VFFVGQGGTPVPVDCVVPGLYPTIQSAVDTQSCTTIRLVAATYHEIVTINRDVTILGSSPTLTTVNGSGMINSVFTINSGTVTLDGLTITGGASVLGGGIQNSGTLTVTNSTITGNNADINGGGIENEGTATITSSTISGNTSGNYGGGIANIGGKFYSNPSVTSTLTVTGSTFSGNTAQRYGGGIANLGGTATITYNKFYSNTAPYGMWLFNYGGYGSFSPLTLTCNYVDPSNLYPRIGGTNIC